MRIFKKAISILVLLMLVCVPLTVMAPQADAAQINQLHIPWQTNPLYEGIIDTSVSVQSPVLNATQEQTETEYLEFSEAALYIRKQMLQRNNSFSVGVISETHSTDAEYMQFVESIVAQAIAHTGVPNEGDYLKWHYSGCSCDVFDDSNGNITLSFSMQYYTTAEQEAIVDKEVDKILKTLNLQGKSDYEKLLAVYEYICSNVEYDHAAVENPNENLLAFTAYGALVENSAVCQGYANLLYRLILELDIDSRVISGMGGGIGHAWNIVRLDGLYYNLDATWDAGQTTYRYFLKSESSFLDHVRDEEYTTNEFHTQYPMSTASYSEETDITDLIAALPKISDPLGTKYYFYNQLSDIEKVLYWKLTEATWENPIITISGLDNYTIEELELFAERSLTALLSDQPRYALLWQRSGFFWYEFEKGTLVFSPLQETGSSDYIIRKANARAQEIVETVGMEGDLYSRTKDLIGIMTTEMEMERIFEFVPAARARLINSTCAGCLAYGVGIFGSYADTFKILCDELEIPCVIIGSEERTWNFVRLEDNCWYFVDTSTHVPDDWNYYIIGSDSPNYNKEPHYCESEWYLGRVGFFTFPDLHTETYVYSGNYKPSYHKATTQFVEPEPTYRYLINEDNTSCTIVAYEGPQKGGLIIPEKVDGYVVTGIGECAFFACRGFTGDLIIPDTVTRVEDYAFTNCKGMTGNLQLSANLEYIGAGAFQNNKFSGQLVLPDTLQRINSNAFKFCENFTGDLRIPDGVEEISNAFSFCSGLDGTLYLPDSIDWFSVWSDVPFAGTKFTSIAVNPQSTKYAIYDGVLYSKDMKTLLYSPNGKPGVLIVPAGVEVIAKYACYLNEGLEGVLLPDGLKEIGMSAFKDSKISGNLVIPNTVEIIGSYAFSSCENLTGNLTLPEGIQTIESSAFFSPFTGDLYIPDSVTTIREWGLKGDFDGKVHMSESIETIERYAIYGDFSNTLTLKDSDVFLAENAFTGAWFKHFECNCGVEFIKNYNSQYCSRCGGGYYDVKPVSINTQPKTGYAQMGKSVKVTVEAEGKDLTYQWYVKNAGASKYVKSSVTSAAYSAKMSDKVKGRRVYCVITDKYGDSVQTKTVMLREAVSIVTEPKTTYAKSGETAKVTVEASGDELSYQWYVKNAGSDKYSKSSITKSTYSVKMSEKVNGRRVYCVVTDKYGKTVQSKSVLLREAVSIVTEPKTTYAQSGKTAKVTVEASGDELTYQWYIKNAGGSKYSKSSVTSATYTAKMSDKVKGRRVYCVITDQYGNSVQSKTVLLREAVSIVTEPKATYAKSGKTAKVTVEASGDELTYQWYIKNAGAEKYSKSSVTSSAYSVTMSNMVHGRRVYCVVTDKYGKTAQTKTVLLRMAATITTQPKNVTVEEGKTAKVTVKAVGDALTYQWYIKNEGASKFSKSTVTSATYSCKMSVKADGRQVYCVVTDKYGKTVKTNTVTLKMK